MNGFGQIRSYYEINKQMKLEEDSVILSEKDLILHKRIY